MKKPTKKKPVDTTVSPPRRGHQLPARAQEPLWKVLQRLAQKERRSIAQTIIFLLEEALEARSLWPPSDEKIGR